MYQKKYVATGFLASVLLSTNALGNPASTDYVKTSVDALRNELSLKINTLTSSMNSSQKQINEISNTTSQLRTKTNELTNTVNELNLTLKSLINKMSDSDINTTTKIEIVQKKITDLPIVTHHLGEIFQGGMVFYIDSTQQHGLMVSLDDLGDELEWRNGEGGDRVTNAHSQGLGSGETNTRLIIAEQTIDQQEGQFAALLAANYQVSQDGKSPCSPTMNATLTCYGGWYLPSVYELVLLQSTLKNQGLVDFKEDLYWSSTESDTTQAWLVNFASGVPQISEKSTRAHVRAIHSF